MYCMLFTRGYSPILFIPFSYSDIGILSHIYIVAFWHPSIHQFWKLFLRILRMVISSLCTIKNLRVLWTYDFMGVLKTFSRLDSIPFLSFSQLLPIPFHSNLTEIYQILNSNLSAFHISNSFFSSPPQVLLIQLMN